MLKINRLVSGGVITNYKCSSKCKHCSYSCSPSWDRDYMDENTADRIFKLLRKQGCNSVHIGGGEPMLEPEKLLQVLDSAASNGVSVEYIETNASWYIDEERTMSILKAIKKHGVNTLLISIDPFHNEYIPFWKTKSLIKACYNAGVGVFPWQMEFWPDLESFDERKTHSLKEYEEEFGKRYVDKLPGRYGINLKGRAFDTFKSQLKLQPLNEILRNSKPCGLLWGVYHFHVDLYENFIPQSCPGFSIKFEEVVKGADPEKYQIIYNIDTKGVAGLYEYAVNRHGYTPKEEYAGKCDLCYDIRNYLVLDLNQDLPDLQPSGHYKYI